MSNGQKHEREVIRWMRGDLGCTDVVRVGGDHPAVEFTTPDGRRLRHRLAGSPSSGNWERDTRRALRRMVLGGRTFGFNHCGRRTA